MQMQIETTSLTKNSRAKICHRKKERTNTWMNSFRSLLNRFDATTESWKGFNYLFFFVIALKKSIKEKI